MSKLRQSELSKPKNLRSINGKIDSKLNSDSLPSSPASHKSSSGSTNTRIYKNQMDEESIFKLYYEDNKNLLENEYPDMPKDDIKRYLRKTWDNMDAEYRKKLGLHMTNESAHLKESSADEDELSSEIDTTVKENKKTRSRSEYRKKLRIHVTNESSHLKESSPDEDEISSELDTTVKENRKTRSKSEYRKKFGLNMTNESSHSKESTPDEDEVSIENDTGKDGKKTKSKIDGEEGSVSETKRSRLYNLFKGMKQEKVCQICEKTGKLTRCKGPCYSYFHLSCVKPGESSPEYSVDENTLDDRLLSDLNIIKRSINDENENNGN